MGCVGAGGEKGIWIWYTGRMKQNFKRITIDPEIMLGKPVVAGTRIPVAVILDLVAEGYTTKKIIKEYPTLTETDVQAAVKFAAGLTNFQEVELPVALHA